MPMELAAGEELEARAEGPVVNEDADELAHERFRVFHQFGEPVVDLRQARQRELGPDRVPGLIADRWLEGSPLPSSLMLSRSHWVESGSRRSVKVRRAESRSETDLDPPVFDAHQVAAADGRGAPGVPPGVPGEPVHRVGGHGPDAALVPDGQGSAGRGEPDVHGNVQGCFIRYCCHGLRVLPSSWSSFLPGG